MKLMSIQFECKCGWTITRGLGVTETIQYLTCESCGQRHFIGVQGEGNHAAIVIGEGARQ